MVKEAQIYGRRGGADPTALETPSYFTPSVFSADLARFIPSTLSQMWFCSPGNSVHCGRFTWAHEDIPVSRRVRSLRRS